eukprot:jgi/Undpi1/11849/HiC_scaffold_4.g01548.m1
MPRGHGVRLQERTLRGWKRKGSLDCIGWSQRCQGGGGLGLGNLFSGSNVRAAATGKGGDGSAVSMSLKMPPSSSSSPTSSSTSSSGGLLDGSDGGCGGESSASSLRSPLSTGNGNGGGDGVGGVGAMAKSSAIDPAEDSNRLGREKDSTKGERKGWGLNWRDHKKKNKSKSREKNESRVSGATALAGGEQEHQQQGGKEDGEGGTKRKGPFTYDWENGGRVKWVANKESKAIVEEGGRKLSDYLALPPTEYSLLDPKMITRLTEDTFKMDCGTLNIVGTKVNPVLFVRVEVKPEQSQANIMVERVELGGSEAVRSAGGTFNVTSSTVVSCADIEDSGEHNSHMLQLRTEANIEIEMLVPNENFVPLGVLRRTGSFVMQRVLDIGLPQFTRFLKRDYGRWTEGDDDRAAVASAEESLIASDV